MARDEPAPSGLVEAAIEVEVVHASPGRSWRVPLRLPAGSTVEDAITASGLRERLVDTAGVGVHGRLCAPTQLLHDGDRIELYRPLIIDPKERRRRRAGQR